MPFARSRTALLWAGWARAKRKYNSDNSIKNPIVGLLSRGFVQQLERFIGLVILQIDLGEVLIGGQ
jgi:hypothetical protein